MSEPHLPPAEGDDAPQQLRYPFIDHNVPPLWEPDSVAQPIPAPPPPPASLLSNPSQPYDWANPNSEQTRPQRSFGAVISNFGCGVLATVLLLLILLGVGVKVGALGFLNGNGSGHIQSTSVYTAAQATATQKAKDSNGGSGSGAGTNGGTPGTPQPGVAGANATATPTLFPGETPTVTPTTSPNATPIAGSGIPTNTPASGATATTVPPTAIVPIQVTLNVINISISGHKVDFTVTTVGTINITITITCLGQVDTSTTDTVVNSNGYDFKLNTCKGAPIILLTVIGHASGFLDKTVINTLSDNKG